MFPCMGCLCSLFVCILLNMSSSSKQTFKRTGGRTYADAQASGNKAYTWQFHKSARCALHFILPARNISFLQRVSFRAGRRTEGVMKWLEHEWLFFETRITMNLQLGVANFSWIKLTSVRWIPTKIIYEKFVANSWEFMSQINTNYHELTTNFSWI